LKPRGLLQLSIYTVSQLAMQLLMIDS